MNKILFTFAALVAAIMLYGCSSGSRKTGGTEADIEAITDSAALIKPLYAKGFSVRYVEGGVRLVDVTDPQRGKGMKHKSKHDSDAGGRMSGKSNQMAAEYHFALIPRGTKAEVPEGYTAVEVPIRNTICMTLLQLSNFTALDAHNFICGITGTKNLYNADILKRVGDGRIAKIGTEGNFDPEVIMAANPDVIFISPFKRGGYEAIRETGITLVPHLGYKELDPLGQAEWVKFVGMFIGREKEANKVFDGIAERYNKVKSLAAGATTRPTVFSGEMHGGNWYAVGGRSYLAQLFRDAGADYIVKDDNTGGVNIEFEKMYAMAANADYWRILNSFPGTFSYDALKSAEPRNADFKAFRERRVIYCNMQRSPYYEITPVEPDVVLLDLVAIFHPELVTSGHKPEFYSILE